MLHNLPPKRPQTSLFFPTAPRHHRTAGPQTHKCCNYLSLSSILFSLSPLTSHSLLLSLLLSPLLPSLPLGSLTIPWQSAFIRSLWWKPIVTKVSGCQPQRPFRGLAVCTLHLSSPPCHSLLLLLLLPPPFSPPSSSSLRTISAVFVSSWGPFRHSCHCFPLQCTFTYVNRC